ncbi:MAG: LamG domain-containing protein [Actinobacteria bacterium]|nr:LamG domain-containing protein [Actinomycetota bacterium]
MAVVENGLLHYWNAQDGIKSGNVLANIAPGQSAKSLSIVGATMQGDALRLDGVDDYVGFDASGTAYETAGSPFSLDTIYTPLTFGTADFEIFDVGFYFMRTGTNEVYIEVYHTDESFSTSTFPAPALGNTTPIQITITYNGGTSFKIYFNGSLLTDVTLSQQTAFSIAGYNAFTMGRGLYSSPYSADLYAMRFYTTELTATEVTQNWNNGTAIGLDAPASLVKIAELRIEGAIGVIPVYNIADFPNESLRISLDGVIGFLRLVEIGDPLSSNVRINTSSGIKTLMKEG